MENWKDSLDLCNENHRKCSALTIFFRWFAICTNQKWLFVVKVHCIFVSHAKQLRICNVNWRISMTKMYPRVFTYKSVVFGDTRPCTGSKLVVGLHLCPPIKPDELVVRCVLMPLSIAQMQFHNLGFFGLLSILFVKSNESNRK